MYVRRADFEFCFPVVLLFCCSFFYLVSHDCKDDLALICPRNRIFVYGIEIISEPADLARITSIKTKSHNYRQITGYEPLYAIQVKTVSSTNHC